MKTAEEWSAEWLGAGETKTSFMLLAKRMQLDAYRQGMTDAATAVNGLRGGACIGNCYDAILTARDNKKEL